MPGLHNRTGLWGQAVGVVWPRVVVDRLVETRAGFEALMFHEALHVHEHHALAGIVLLSLGMAGSAVSLVLEHPEGFGAFLLAGVAAWFLWRREQEIRSDAFAMRGASTEADGKVTPRSMRDGLREFRAFTLLHPHPRGWFWKWCYGRSPKHRVRRAKARMGRTRWAAR